MGCYTIVFIQGHAQGTNEKLKQAGKRLIHAGTTTPLQVLHLLRTIYSPATSDSDNATLSSSTNYTAASQVSTTSTRGPCNGILIGSDFALAFEFFPMRSPLVDEDERFRFSNAFCSTRARCLSAAGARMMRPQSSDSV